MDEAAEYLSRDAAAALLNVEVRTLDYMVARGVLAVDHRTPRGTKQSRPWFSRAVVEALRKQRQEGKR